MRINELCEKNSTMRETHRSSLIAQIYAHSIRNKKAHLIRVMDQILAMNLDRIGFKLQFLITSITLAYYLFSLILTFIIYKLGVISKCQTY